MRFPQLHEGRLLRRYARFLADVELSSGALVTAIVANTGSLLTCNQPGLQVWLTERQKPGKHQFAWLLVRPQRSLVCVDTSIPNRLVFEAAQGQQIPQLAGYMEYLSEVAYGNNSRADMLCRIHRDDMLRRCWVEVKSTTLKRGQTAYFPDAVTSRGKKHLIELQRKVAYGDAAMQIFFIQRGDCTSFRPADDIDPAYGLELRQAAAAGVQIIALRAKVSKQAITVDRQIPVEL